MRYFYSLLALIALYPASLAQAKDTNPAAGLWDGTIGTLPIRVCLNSDGRVAGTYYYLSQLKPIALMPPEKNGSGPMIEQVGYEQPTGGSWSLSNIGDETITGIWRNQSRKLPIKLNRIAYTSGEYAGACESAEFFAPRAVKGSIVESAAMLGPIAYSKLVYDSGGIFDPHDVEIESFALKAEQPGDIAINEVLRAVIPDKTGASSMMECMGMMYVSRGWDGYFSRSVTPEVISDKWLGAVSSQGAYCGGAHPSYWQSRQVFDRQSGKEVDPSDWFIPGALGISDVESYHGPVRKYVENLSPPLAALFVARFPKDNSECLDGDDGSLDGLAFSWDIGLVREGIVFKPNVAHAITPCAESIVLPWSEIEPFLNEDGRGVRASL